MKLAIAVVSIAAYADAAIGHPSRVFSRAGVMSRTGYRRAIRERGEAQRRQRQALWMDNDSINTYANDLMRRSSHEPLEQNLDSIFFDWKYQNQPFILSNWLYVINLI